MTSTDPDSTTDRAVPPLDAIERAVGALALSLTESAIVVGDVATWLGAALEPRRGKLEPVERTGDPTLYDGSAGIAWAAVEAGRALDDRGLVDVAELAARHALTRVSSVPRVGLYDGRAGIGLAALLVGSRVDDGELIDRGSEVLIGCADATPDRSDLISGWSGLALAWSRAAALTGEDRWQRLAATAAQRLVECADRRPWGWAWPEGPDDPGLCGLAHGSSGVALALAEAGAPAFDVGSDDGVRAAIDGALRYERSWFDPRRGWPDLRESVGPEAPRPALWCHGAAGIGLTRLALLELDGAPRFAGEAAAAVQTTYTTAVDDLSNGRFDHGLTLCHGLAGRLELLLEAHVVFGERAHFDAACGLAGAALAALGDDPSTWPSGHRRGAAPGLMNGIAGSLLTLTRILHPDRVAGAGLLRTDAPSHVEFPASAS